jgi:hypothetical protein
MILPANCRRDPDPQMAIATQLPANSMAYAKIPKHSLCPDRGPQNFIFRDPVKFVTGADSPQPLGLTLGTSEGECHDRSQRLGDCKPHFLFGHDPAFC